MAMILCVDDEPAIGSVVGHALQRLGHTCRAVASVEDALRAVALSPFDLIIADHQMPDQTGLDLIRLLAAEGCRVPVIIMTVTPAWRTRSRPSRAGRSITSRSP